MMIEQHYDEEVLAAFLDEPSDAEERDLHLGACGFCRQTLGSLRETVDLLKDGSVWDARPMESAPQPETIAFLRNAAARLADEDSIAERHVALLLSGSREEWALRLDGHPQWHTAGLVRKLIAATDRFNFSVPLDAVEVTRLALSVAKGLPAETPGRRSLLADAWREHAYALNYTSAHREALEAVDQADLALGSEGTDYDRARVLLMRAMVIRMMDRGPEAASLAGRAAEIFERFGDVRKYVSARMTEAVMLYDASLFREALDVMVRLRPHEPSMDATAFGTLLLSRAMTHREVGDFERAETCFVQSVRIFEQIGATALLCRAHWHLGRLLMRKVEYQRALPLLDRVRGEFRELGMPHEVAYVSVDMAECLLLLERSAEVADLCRSAMSFFESAALSSGKGAMTALAYLREAAASGRLSREHLSDVRGFFDVLPRQPNLVFARPSM